MLRTLMVVSELTRVCRVFGIYKVKHGAYF